MLIQYKFHRMFSESEEYIDKKYEMRCGVQVVQTSEE